jgi:YkgG family uncharacterized protein
VSATAVPDRFTTLPDEHALAVTAGGTLVIASAPGSQLASCAWGAANVIFVAGAQKLVPTLAAAHQRICTHSLPLEDARAQAPAGSTARSGRSSRSTRNCPAASTSSSSARRPASRPPSQPDLPSAPGGGP